MGDTAIKIENLGKLYRLGEVGTGTLSHDLNRWWHRVRGKEDPYLKIGQANERAKKSESEYVWALRDINLEVKKGEVLGIIGRNGAGKSTLLKILSQVTSPTTGRVEVFGRIASLLEVGTGFHPELTGRENIFLNGAILGMRRHEIQKKFDEIVDFAGVEAYIDTPVKRYSSGMYVRLAFAVAAFLEPEILVVDEVLAVGDAEFQKKCLGRMKDVSVNEGRTVLFVSHNMAAIENLCPSSLLLANGSNEFLGPSIDTIARYLSAGVAEKKSVVDRTDREGLGRIKIKRVDLDSHDIKTGDALKIRISYDILPSPNEVRPIEFGISIWTELGVRLISISTEMTSFGVRGIERAKDSVECRISSLSLVAGRYTINSFVSSQHGIEDYLLDCASLTVSESDYYGTGKTVNPQWGMVVVDHEWIGE